MGILRHVLTRIFDALDPPKRSRKSPRAVCPGCRQDVLDTHVKRSEDVDLTFFLCRCGRATAWHLDGEVPQLIYGSDPPELDDGDIDDGD